MCNTSFKRDKAIESMLMLLEMSGDSIHSVMRVLYLADCIHLERWGRLISHDIYIISKGDVYGVGVANILLNCGSITQDGIELTPTGGNLELMEETLITAKRRADTNLLSVSDEEAIKQARDNYTLSTANNETFKRSLSKHSGIINVLGMAKYSGDEALMDYILNY